MGDAVASAITSLRTDIQAKIDANAKAISGIEDISAVKAAFKTEIDEVTAAADAKITAIEAKLGETEASVAAIIGKETKKGGHGLDNKFEEDLDDNHEVSFDMEAMKKHLGTGVGLL